MELTTEEKEMIINLISQVSFRVGQSEEAKKYEVLLEKLKVVDKEK